MPLPGDIHAPLDFDFILGDWCVRHHRLNTRLAGCRDWTAFDGLSSTVATLGGFGNLEDNLLHFPEGSYRAVALRSYCQTTGTWSIWWLDGRAPGALDVPVVGRFFDGAGVFYADDVHCGVPIKVRFTWTAAPASRPRWEQAFSDDGGLTWETNWTMDFTRAGAPQ